MDILGKWRIAEALKFDEDMNRSWKTVEQIRSEYESEEESNDMLDMIYIFREDGLIDMAMPYPKNVTQEELDEAFASGEVFKSDIPGYFTTGETLGWKYENGTYYYDTGIRGTVFDGEPVDPWAPLEVTENGIQMIAYRLVKAD